MQELNLQEIEEVSGGAMNIPTAAKVTLGLMALGIGSPFVVGAGVVALVTYAWL